MGGPHRCAPLSAEIILCGYPFLTKRAAMNAILYLLRTGYSWRHSPRDGFPPRSTV
jgi:transposase